MRKNPFLLILATMLLSCLYTFPVFAQGISFGLRPEDTSIGYFEYTMMPGETLEDAVLAINASDQHMLLKVSVAAGHTALRGGLTFTGGAGGPAEWINLRNEGILEVPANKQIRLPFTVQVPKETPPGEYVAGFLIEEANPDTAINSQSTMGVRVIPKMGLTVLITVPGKHTCGLEIESFSDEVQNGEWKVQIQLQNTGNTHFKGSGEFQVRSSSSGEVTHEEDFDIGYFVPGDSMTYPLYFEAPPAEGEYSADISILGENCALEKEFSQPFTISPDKAELAREEAKRWALAEAAANEAAAKELARAELLHSAGIVLLGLSGLILVALICLVVLSKRKRRTEEDKTMKTRPRRSKLRGRIQSS